MTRSQDKACHLVILSLMIRTVAVVGKGDHVAFNINAIWSFGQLQLFHCGAILKYEILFVVRIGTLIYQVGSYISHCKPKVEPCTYICNA